MGRNYTFPARREEIECCNDVNQLKEWQQHFELTLGQMETDFGGLENVPEKLYKYAKANENNLKQIRFRINKLTGPVTSAGALKAFHDTVKQFLPRSEYESIVERTKAVLGKTDEDWEEMIKYRKK